MVVVEAKPDNISHRYTDTHTQTYAEAHGRPTWQWQGAQGGLDERASIGLDETTCRRRRWPVDRRSGAEDRGGW